jgi:hypothetical protein
MKNRGFLNIYDRLISDLLNFVGILISIFPEQLQVQEAGHKPSCYKMN